MKGCPSKRLRIAGRLLCITAAVLFLAAGPTALGAAREAPNDHPKPIEITADQLVTNSTAHTAEFSGNVTAIQGETTVTADRLVLHYGSTGTSTEDGNRTNIEKFEAFGNVRIQFDNRLAVSDQAVYTTRDRRLVLTGPESKVSSGGDEVSGTQIVFDRNTDQVTITGDQKSQVKAVIHSNQRGLN
jgi:lipopolysaccharide export system protein LptA